VRQSCLLVLTASICLLADDRTRNDSVVASVNGETITSAQLEASVRPQVAALEDRIRQLREAGLNKLIDNLLLEQAARAEGITTDEYLKRHVESVGVSSSDVDQAYSRSRDQFGNALPAEARYRIRRTLEDNARASALQSLLQKLRSEATVTNLLVADAFAALSAAAHEGPSWGPAEAPVTIIEFSDFECPYCRSAQTNVRRVMERWPGQIRLVFKHFPLDRHPNAAPAAKAAVCADRQGRFRALHDRMFESARGLSDEAIRAAAGAAGLNAGEFNACMASDEAMDHVRKDILLGRMVGVTGTPAFFVNGHAVAGFDALEPAVERILGGAR
jgi:protein-disulfide isomerase